VGKGFKEAVGRVPEEEWKPLKKEIKREKFTILAETGKEYADVVYVPQSLSSSKKEAEYRFIAIREGFDGKVDEKKPGGQLLIAGMIEELEAGNEKIKKLHLTELKGKVYKIFGLVTNMLKADGGEVIRWHHGRCGKSEELHRILKDKLAGGHVASRRFRADAAVRIEGSIPERERCGLMGLSTFR
jgi:hypothetical protein